MKAETENEVLGAIRKQFYTYRNGIVADTLRKGGLEQKYIFGLQLPTIKEIAGQFRPDSPEAGASLARALWHDRECREARLLACHLMPAETISESEAMEWGEDIRTREEGDILAFRLLRYLPYASGMAESLEKSENPLHRYLASAIKRFL